MTLVMDGVRGSMSPRLLPVASAVPRVTRLTAAPAPTGVRYVTDFDGIRRPVAPASPRQVLEAIAPALAAPSLPTAVLEPTSHTWKLQPPIAFGLVAAAVVAGSVLAVATTLTTPARIVEKSAPATQATPPATPTVPAVPAHQADLQQVVDSFVASQPAGMYGIVVKDLKTGATATSGAERQLTSASLYKLFVAQQIYRQIDNGQLAYGAAAGGGTGRNIESCLQVMINVSDNACGRALGTMLGWGKQNESLKNAGYTGTDLAQPQQTSARDVALMLERLYEGTLNSPNSNARFLNLLKDQRVNNRLPVGLPAGTVIAHKTGDLDGYTHDAGIVYGPKTDYLVVVTSGPWGTPGNAPSQFAKFSSQLWSFFQQ